MLDLIICTDVLCQGFPTFKLHVTHLRILLKRRRFSFSMSGKGPSTYNSKMLSANVAASGHQRLKPGLKNVCLHQGPGQKQTADANWTLEERLLKADL